jgi:hypothetical protein
MALVTEVPDLLFRSYPEVPRDLYDRLRAAAPVEVP